MIGGDSHPPASVISIIIRYALRSVALGARRDPTCARDGDGRSEKREGKVPSNRLRLSSGAVSQTASTEDDAFMGTGPGIWQDWKKLACRIGMQPVGHYTDIIRMKKSARPIQMPSRSRDRVFDYDDLLEYR